MTRFNYLQPAYERWYAGIPAVALAGAVRVPLLLIGLAFLGLAATWTIARVLPAGAGCSAAYVIAFLKRSTVASI